MNKLHVRNLFIRYDITSRLGKLQIFTFEVCFRNFQIGCVSSELDDDGGSGTVCFAASTSILSVSSDIL